MRLVSLTFLCLALVGCGRSKLVAAGDRNDAGSVIIESPDATDIPPDAGDDAGPVDAGELDAGEPDAGDLDAGPVDAGEADAGEVDAGTPPIADLCFSDINGPGQKGPNYDQYHPKVASHCFGTNHQDITGIQRVVFVGDSVTVGTPPTLADKNYRYLLAQELAKKFNLKAPSSLWSSQDLLNGVALVRQDGDFWSCAKWGARADDLIQDNTQLEDCFPLAERSKKTLVVMTMGGNDIASLTQKGYNRSYADNFAQTQEFVTLLREAVEWMKNPTNIPGGVDVLFANMYEYTDATGDTSSCLIDFGPIGQTLFTDFSGYKPWNNPNDLKDLVIWANEQYMKIAVDTNSDMIFMLEHFCGHGFHNNDQSSPCYRGPNTPRWFDLTCIHPNPEGHAKIAEMFMSEVNE